MFKVEEEHKLLFEILEQGAGGGCAGLRELLPHLGHGVDVCLGESGCWMAPGGRGLIGRGMVQGGRGLVNKQFLSQDLALLMS